MPLPESMTIKDWKDLARRCRQWAKDAKKRGDKEKTAHWEKRAAELEKLVVTLEKEKEAEAEDFQKKEKKEKKNTKIWWYPQY